MDRNLTAVLTLYDGARKQTRWWEAAQRDAVELRAGWEALRQEIIVERAERAARARPEL